ncbi:MAG: hypothetical protein JST12_10055 [Armatimonadetes bacterium]|nr:hypothetical protein [Armatimonadota bacterium]
MKKIVAAMLGLFACIAFGQPKGPSNFFKTLKIEATIVVKKHPMGSDLVELTILGTKFPADGVQEKLDALAKELGDQPRGVQTSIVDGQFVKSSFAINGIIQTNPLRFNLVALARAMAFGQYPIKSFSVLFDGCSPGGKTVAAFDPVDGSWKFEGVATRSPLAIEYRVQVNADKPEAITLPDENTRPKAPAPEQKNPAQFYIWAGIIVGALAIGLLVYSALLRPRPRGR